MDWSKLLEFDRVLNPYIWASGVLISGSILALAKFQVDLPGLSDLVAKQGMWISIILIVSTCLLFVSWFKQWRDYRYWDRQRKQKLHRMG